MILHGLMPVLALFIQEASRDPVYFTSWVTTIVVSVVLHELGHGYAALRQGDDTPRTSGHMTLNPLVHMGGFSLVMLAVAGIAWGQMPVNPARFRDRHGDAIVSAAGPAVNLGLALLGLTALGLWQRFSEPPTTSIGENFTTFFWVFGTANLVLFLLNLIPIPPLDGSRVVASFFPGYRRWSTNPQNGGVFMALFIGVFLAAGYLFEAAGVAGITWITLLRGY